MQTNDLNGNGFSNRMGALAATALSAVTLALAGCAVGSIGGPGAVTAVPAAQKFSGQVHGGQQPISNATIQLYAVGTGGNGTAATALLSPAPVTNANGQFNLGTFTCPANAMVYLTATQGNPGLGAGQNNSAIAAMSALGSCATLQANIATTYININELTTVAAVYALSAFTTDFSSVAYGNGNLSGVTNAFATASLLANTSTGGVPGVTPASGITYPTATLISLADAIASCINSTGPSSSGCSTLFTAATPAGGSAPANTIAALANISHNPAANVASIFGLVNAAAPYAGALNAAPSDWTMSINYTGGGLALPNGIAIDSLGNAWVANEGGNAITEIGGGTFLSGSSGFNSSSLVGPQGIAIDASNQVWVANTGADNVLNLNSAGAIQFAVTAGLSGPVSVALDSSGDAWVTNFDGNSIAAFSQSGSPLPGSPYTGAALAGPTGVAIDASNNVWVSSSVTGLVAKFSSAGVYQNAYSDLLLIAPSGIATDSAHNRIWIATTGISAISALTTGGDRALPTPLTGGGIAQPLSVAIDGAGTVWTVNNATTGSVTAFTTALGVKTPATGLGLLNLPVGLALDASGNLWSTNAGDNSVTEFIGLASPVATPLVNSSR